MEEVKIEDYLISVRNFYKYMGVRPGEQVLLLPTFEYLNSDPLALEALKQVGKEMGVEVSIAIVDAYGTRGNPPKPIARAIESSDVFIGLGDKAPNPVDGHNLTALRARWDGGAKQVDIQGGKGILAAECSKFPIEIFLAITRSMLAKLNRGKKLEIVDDKGTHLYVHYKPWDIYTGGALKGDHIEPGQRITWPLGNITFMPEDASGVAMVDCIRGVHKILEKPIKFTIEKCWVVEIEDREETKRIQTEWSKPENSNFWSRMMIGLNPKASISKGVYRSRFGELCQAAGVTRMAIGDRQGIVSSNFNATGFLINPTIMMEGEVLFDHGRPSALDDPKVREVASKYGDPDQLLARVP